MPEVTKEDMTAANVPSFQSNYQTPQEPQTPLNAPQTVELLESQISLFIQNCQRAQVDAKNAAITHLRKVMDYKVERATKKGFDFSGRQLKGLFEDFEVIKISGENAKMDTKEGFIDSVNKFLEETKPSWKNIKGAYDLCRAKGFDASGSFEKTLKDKPDNDSIKYEMCDAIEEFLANLK